MSLTKRGGQAGKRNQMPAPNQPDHTLNGDISGVICNFFNKIDFLFFLVIHSICRTYEEMIKYSVE